MNSGKRSFNDDPYLLSDENQHTPLTGNALRKCYVNVAAMVKMLTHAKKGGVVEVMGYLRGKVEGDTFIVLDAYPLPVDATETRVNAGADALEYTGKIEDLNERLKKKENCVGWYHSHPNYGPWLSGIDVATQKMMQMNDPMVAIVVDPIRSEISGKLDIGAFRTCSEEDNPQIGNEMGDLIPEDKEKDFGIHYKQYYKLDMAYFANDIDMSLIEVIVRLTIANMGEILEKYSI